MAHRRQDSGASLPHVEPIPLLGFNKQEESFDAPFDRRSEVYRALAYEHGHGAAAASDGGGGGGGGAGGAGGGSGGGGGARQPLLTVPNVLTFLRLALVPVVMALWYAEGVPGAPLLAALLFVLASLTDWLDGYLARRFEIATTFGAFLDPVADKVMVSTVLILLSVNPPPPISHGGMAVPVVLMCNREVTMSALREWAASAGGAAHRAVKVNSLGKWKTAMQMTSMSMLLFCRDETGRVARLCAALHVTVEQVAAFSWVLLLVATALALVSLANYFANVWSHFVLPMATKKKL